MRVTGVVPTFHACPMIDAVQAIIKAHGRNNAVIGPDQWDYLEDLTEEIRYVSGTNRSAKTGAMLVIDAMRDGHKLTSRQFETMSSRIHDDNPKHKHLTFGESERLLRLADDKTVTLKDFNEALDKIMYNFYHRHKNTKEWMPKC